MCRVSRQNLDRTFRRGGYTLLEMLLVLTLLLVVAGIVYPVFQRLYEDHSLKESVERVRGKLAGTRIRAIDSNVIYQFLFEPGGQWFVILPFEQEAANPNVTGSAAPALASDQTFSGQLPEGFQFQTTDPAEPIFGTLPPEVLAMVPGSIELLNVRWSLPILFYPDGTADERAFDVYDDQPERSYMRLSVRGLTATVIVSDVAAEPQRW